MIIQIGNCGDEAVKLNKTFNARTSLNCEIFEADIVRPILRLSEGSIINSDNYVYIPDFNRYYFKGKIERDGGVILLSLICDVLMSFKDQIKNCPLIAERSTNTFNAYLSDNSRNFLAYSDNTFKDLGYFSGSRLFLLGVG